MLRRSIGDAPITEAVEESARWLEEFHPRSVVELDYGGLVGLLSDEALATDDSPALVAAGLAGLSRGDADGGHRGVREAGGAVAGDPAAGAVQLSAGRR